MANIRPTLAYRRILKLPDSFKSAFELLFSKSPELLDVIEDGWPQSFTGVYFQGEAGFTPEKLDRVELTLRPPK